MSDILQKQSPLLHGLLCFALANLFITNFCLKYNDMAMMWDEGGHILGGKGSYIGLKAFSL